MVTLKHGDELIRRIGCLKRVIRKLTATDGVVGPIIEARNLSDLNTLEAMIIEMGGQVREVPYSKSKLKRLGTQLSPTLHEKKLAEEITRDMVQDTIKYRDVNDEGDSTEIEDASNS